MTGKIGDEIIVRENWALCRAPERQLEVLDAGGVIHYRVRWDDGTDCIFFPGPDARFVRPGARKH